MLTNAAAFAGKSAVFRWLTAALTAFIFLLVPLGRTLQKKLEALIAWFGFAPWLWLLILAAAVLLLAAAYYHHLFRSRSVRYVAAHTMFVLALASLYALWKTSAAIEYVHIPLFALLGALSLASQRTGSVGRKNCIAFVYGAAVSLIDEILQGLHPERVYDTRDLVLNAAGTALGLILLTPFLRSTRK